jgi:uncharacterized protein (DUF952 family)
MAAVNHPDPLPTHVYKILQPVPDVLLQATGPALDSDTQLPDTPLDQKDGYIHLSMRPQVRFVLGRFYAKIDEIVIVKLGYRKLCDFAERQQGAEVTWEKAGTALFPHLYGGAIQGEVVEGWRVLRRDEEAGWERELGQIEEEGWFVD